MADEADIAAHRTDEIIKHAINNPPPVNRLAPNGWCHNCDEEVAGERLFCDGVCAAQFDKRSKRR